MSMENYSPSNPTEVDLDNSPDEKPIIIEFYNDPKASTKLDKKSQSKSPEIRNMPKAKSRSRSRKRKSRSRSKNRRSRSRNKTEKYFLKDRDHSNRGDLRSRSKEKRSRSKERRSRSKDRRPRSKDRRSRSREKRSRSRDSRKFYSKSRDSPCQFRQKEGRSSIERKNDNIFSKMTELSAVPIQINEHTVKTKWAYDSDDDNNASTKQENMNIFDAIHRYDDMKPLARRSANSKDSSFSENRCDDMKPLPRRSEYNNRRGVDQSREFIARESRNDRPNFQSRNDQRFNRNNSGFINNDIKSDWSNSRHDDNLGHKSDNFSDSSRKMSWNEGKQTLDDAEMNAWTNSERNNSPARQVVLKHSGDSDEEFGSWGKDRQNDISEMLTIANLESQGIKKTELQQSRSTNNTQSSPETNKDKVANNSDEEFGTWGNEQKTITKQSNDSLQIRNDNRNNNNRNQNSSQKPNVDSDSDEEFGSWGKDRKIGSNSNQSSNNKSDSYGSSMQPFQSQNQRSNFNRNNDGNNRFQGRRGGNNNFNRFQRPNNQERFNNNSNNQDRFSNNTNNQDRFNNNFNNNNASFNINNFNKNNANNVALNATGLQADNMSQMPLQIPPYNFNPTQRPPQWPPINNMNFPPMVNGQLSFNAMPMLPQMQFSQMNQQPPLSIPNLMQTISYIPPPPPSTQPTGIINQSQSNNFNSSLSQNSNDSNNLLETIMTNVGLSSKTIRLQSDMFKPQPQQNKSSVSDSLSNIIKSAASTVLSRLVENSQKSNNIAGNISDSMSMSPPSPTSSPPPVRHVFNPMSSENSEFVLPPLPNYSDILKPSTNNLPNVASSHSNNVQSSEISEEKRNRSDFDSKGDWQERIALEVKNFLRPAYMSKKINKSDYKEIMKRCVTKISRSGVTEINTEKIEKFVLSYVDKYQKFRRGKQHGVVSSSEHELVM